MRGIFFILILCITLIPSNGFSQKNITLGSPYVQNYNNDDYNSPEDQTWSILQDKRGVMYFGKSNGILEFDGNNWRLIEMPNKSIVRSLAMDNSTERIYVGAVGDFGYLKAHHTGVLQYVSLLDKVPEKFRNFEDVRKIVILDKQVIFVSYAYIFLLEENKIKPIIPNNRFHFGFGVNNKFYVRDLRKGLFTLEDDSLKFIEKSEQFENDRIYVMLPYLDDKILMITGTQGIFIYSPNSEATDRFVKLSQFRKIDDFNNKNKIYSGVKLNEKLFVCGTLQDGLIIFDKKGRIIQHINKESGLQDPIVFNLYIDLYNNIWAALNNGISYIILNSPFTRYDEKNGFEGDTRFANIYKNQLYVGTSQGIFKKGQSNKFSLVENTKGPSWCCKEVGEELLFGHSEGIFELRNNILKKIDLDIETVWTLKELSKTPYMLAGTNNGLRLLERNNLGWKLKNKIKGFNESSRYFEVDSGNIIWVSHPNKGIFKLKLNELLDGIEIFEFYDNKDGLPAKTNNFVFNIELENKQSQIIFGTENGIYSYNHQNNKFESNDQFKLLLKNEGEINRFIQINRKEIFYQQGDEMGILVVQDDGSYKSNKTPFLKFKGEHIEGTSILDSTKFMICFNKVVVQYNSGIEPNYSDAFRVIIRKVNVKDSIIFDGGYNLNKEIELPYRFNDLQFSFTALFYENHSKTKYSYYLEGYSDDWSEWSLKSEKEYTNLPAGSYVFKVKAKNIYEKESTVTSYEFKILKPWFATIFAYILYSFIAALLIWFILKLYSRKLLKDKERLEKIVHERTMKIVEQKENIEEQNLELEHQKDAITEQSNELRVQMDYTNKQKKLIERQNAELEKHRNNLEQTVQQRTLELVKAKVKAEESDKLKSAFLANMSHEIRTPMNAIIGFTSLLNNTDIPLKERNKLSDLVIENSESLLRLIEDIIDIAKLESGQVSINMQRFDLNNLFHHIHKIFNDKKRLAKKNQVDLIYPIEDPDKPFYFYSDPVRLRQVLSNLIDNALKFTNKGLVSFGYTVQKKGGKHPIKFFVKDTGIGLSKDQQQLIFNRFTKVENDKKKIYRGAGLGLAICKSIVDLLNGKIWVESEIERGAAFYFTIPNNKIPETKETIEQKVSTLDSFEWPEKTILIVEDEVSNCLYLEMLLAKTKSKILIASNGEEAVELFLKDKVDLVLMDIKLPEIDGLEATRIIKSKNKGIPVIALTAFTMENDEKMCLDAGCDAYLLKPIQENILFNVINDFLKSDYDTS